MSILITSLIGLSFDFYSKIDSKMSKFKDFLLAIYNLVTVVFSTSKVVFSRIPLIS